MKPRVNETFIGAKVADQAEAARQFVAVHGGAFGMSVIIPSAVIVDGTTVDVTVSAHDGRVIFWALADSGAHDVTALFP